MVEITQDPASAGAGKKGDGAKERILAAASILFAREEYEACSIRDIAQAAEVNSALIYYYFGSKEGLLRALIEEAIGMLANLLDSLMLKPEMRVREKLRTFLVAWLGVVAGRGNLKTLMLRTMGTKGSVGDLLRQRIWGNVQRIANILAEGQLHGELRQGFEPELLAMQVLLCVISPVVGFPFPAKVDVSDSEQRGRYVDSALELLFQGIEVRSKDG